MISTARAPSRLRAGGSGRVSATLSGWGNPLPIAIDLPEGMDLAGLRERIAMDISQLVPRAEALDATLPEAMRQRTAYAKSKQHPRFETQLSTAPTRRYPKPTRIDPPPATWLGGVANLGEPLSAFTACTGQIVQVGEVFDPALKDLLASGAMQVVEVTPGDGLATMPKNDAGRPGLDSFDSWLSVHDEIKRSAVSAFVLGREAGPNDVALLRHRLHAHQRILVEAGSPTLIWLSTLWGGSVARRGNVFVFSEPSGAFHEPSRRQRLSTEADWPRISVVTVSFNQGEFLEQCLLSVLDQNYPNLEYIVIDAGSTDGSLEILKRYEHRLSKLVIEPDRGQSDGLNKGFRLATGEILTWINSDDMLAPLSLRRAAIAMAEHGVDLVAGTCSRIDEAGALLYTHHTVFPALQPERFDLKGPLNWCESWEKGDYFFQPEVFFSREIWELAGGYLKPHLYWLMDWDLWLRCALSGARIVRIPDALGISRVHPAQKTTTEEMYLWQLIGILGEYDDMVALLERGATA